MTRLEFVVWGTAVPKGSARAFVPKGWKRPIITTDNNSLKAWEQVVRAELQRVMAESDRTLLMTLFDAPVFVRCVFHLPRPKSLPARVRHHVKRPDVDKLARGLIDALRGVAFRDDVQVAALHAYKVYATVAAKVEIRIDALEQVDVHPEEAGTLWASM